MPSISRFLGCPERECVRQDKTHAGFDRCLRGFLRKLSDGLGDQLSRGRVRRSNSNSCPYNRDNKCWPRWSSIPLLFRLDGLWPDVKQSGHKRKPTQRGGGCCVGFPFIATKWVDFVMADSTRRESCHLTKIVTPRYGVKTCSPNFPAVHLRAFRVVSHSIKLLITGVLSDFSAIITDR